MSSVPPHPSGTRARVGIANLVRTGGTAQVRGTLVDPLLIAVAHPSRGPCSLNVILIASAHLPAPHATPWLD